MAEVAWFSAGQVDKNGFHYYGFRSHRARKSIWDTALLQAPRADVLVLAVADSRHAARRWALLGPVPLAAPLRGVPSPGDPRRDLLSRRRGSLDRTLPALRAVFGGGDFVSPAHESQSALHACECLSRWYEDAANQVARDEKARVAAS